MTLVSNEWLFSLLIWLIGGSYAYASAVLWYTVKTRNNHIKHLQDELETLTDRVQRLED